MQDPWPATAGASGGLAGSIAYDPEVSSAARGASAAGVDFVVGLAFVLPGFASARLVLASDPPGLGSAQLDLAFDQAGSASGRLGLARGSSDPAFAQPDLASEPLAFGLELGPAFDWVLELASDLLEPGSGLQPAAHLVELKIRFKMKIPYH